MGLTGLCSSEILPIPGLKSPRVALPKPPIVGVSLSMSLNLIITLVLVAALALALVARRRAIPSQSKTDAPRRAWRLAKTRVRVTAGGAATEDAPRRMRPRLALSVSGVPTEEAIRIAGTPPTTDGVADDDSPATVAPSQGASGHAVSDEDTLIALHDAALVAMVADPNPVAAPGWPVPGELSGMYKPGEFVPVTEESELADQAVEGIAFATADQLPVTLDVTPGWTDTDGYAPAVAGAQTPDPWDQALQAGYSYDSVATLARQSTPADQVWDEVDGREEGTVDGAQQEWNAVDWEWQSSDADASPQWTEPDVDHPTLIPLAPSETPGTAVATEDAPVHVVQLQTEPFTSDPDTAADERPLTAHDRAIADAVRPIMTSAAATGTPTHVVVVVVPESRSVPSERENELARTVRRLEKQLAALSKPTAAPTKGRSKPRAVDPRPSVVTATVSLTNDELRQLRALAARRSAPIAARRRARIIIASARGRDVKEIAGRVGVHPSTVRRVRQRFASERMAAMGDTRPRSAKR